MLRKKQHNREDRVTEENTKKQDKRVRNDTRTKETRWTSLERWQNSLCREINLHSQQQENLGTSTMRKLWSCKCWPPRTVKNVGIDQTKLLVARNQERCQKICSRMFQMLTEQSTVPKESGRITPIGNTTRTLAGNQYWYYWPTTKVKWKRCYSGYHG